MMTKPDILPDSLLTSYQVGALLQVNPSSINKWVKDGRIPAFRTPGGHRRIRRLDVRVRLHAGRAHARDCTSRLEHEVKMLLERERGRVDSYAARIRDLSPLAVLERGYALVQGPDGSLVRDPARVSPGDPLAIRVQKGTFKAEVKA